MNDLINIKVIQKDFNGEKKRFVNARELYKWLGVGRDFSTWIKDRIDKYDFTEDLDYFTAFPQFGDGQQNVQKTGKIGEWFLIVFATAFLMLSKYHLPAGQNQGGD